MQSLTRKPVAKSAPVSEIAQAEMDAWIEERNRRFANLPTHQAQGARK